MKSNLLLILFNVFFINSLFSQEQTLVTESTISLDLEQTKELFFSFAEGDEIVFDMEMVKGKHIKEIEVVELPSNTILTEFKVRALDGKKIQIQNKGVYKFSFYSSSITRRVCKIKINRIPATESTRKFNTNWKWEIKKDTIYTSYQEDSLVGYQTIKYKETIRELQETKLEEILIFDRLEKIHSVINPKKSRTYIKVALPVLDNSKLKEEKLLNWSYWIGVGKESQEAYKKNVEALSDLTKGLTSTITTPLGAYAIGGVTDLIVANSGNDVQYYFIHKYQDVEKFMNYQEFYSFDNGKVFNSYGRGDNSNQGVFYIALFNDNTFIPLEVDVKVSAVKEIKIYENIVYDREREDPQYVTLNKTRMNVNETKVRVPVE